MFKIINKDNWQINVLLFELSEKIFLDLLDISFDFLVEINLLDDISEDIQGDILIIDYKSYKKYKDTLNFKYKYIFGVIDNSFKIEKINKLQNTFDEIFYEKDLKEILEKKIKFYNKILKTKKENQITYEILNSVDNLVVITDQEGKIEYVNNKFLETTSYRYEEVIGNKPNILKSNKHTEKFYKNLWKTINSNKVWSGMFINKTKYNNLIYEDAIITPIKIDKINDRKKFVKISRNITQMQYNNEKIISNTKLIKEVLNKSLPSKNYNDKNIKIEYLLEYKDIIGGDLVWYSKINNKYFVLVLDISGRDLTSSLILMDILMIVKDYKNIYSIDKILKMISKRVDFFNENIEIPRFLSVFIGVVDIKEKKLDYINASNLDGYIYNNEVKTLESEYLPLGLNSNQNYKLSNINLKENDKLCIYTDGLLFLESEKFKIKENVKDNKNIIRSVKNELEFHKNIKDDLSIINIGIKT
ncbi:MAG: SpoIIE family protein phosphatase [Bacillota bacterium]